MRKLLEVTHEAFIDSGVDYKALRGSSRVGVYLGCCGSEVHAMWLSDYNSITGYEQTGCTLSMFANRLSFFFNFKGPSKAVDTGALQQSPLFHCQSCCSKAPIPLSVMLQHAPFIISQAAGALQRPRPVLCIEAWHVMPSV